MHIRENNKIRCLIMRRFMPDGVFGGLEKHLIEWLKRVDYNRFDITLAVSAGKSHIFSEKILRENIHVRLMEFDFDFKRFGLKDFFTTMRLFRRARPNHVVYTEGAFTDFPWIHVLAGYIYTKGNVFMSEHLGPLCPPKRISKQYFRYIPGLGLWWKKHIFTFSIRAYLSKNILAVSKEVKDNIVKWYKYPENKITYCYHGVETKKYSAYLPIKLSMRKKLSIPENDIVIISAARLSPIKCIDRLIHAFDKIYDKYKNVWLLIVGDGPLRDNLQSLAIKQISNNKILFLGFQDDVSEYLAMSDLFVLPSDNEGLAIALCEAFSTGLIAIVTKTPGPNEIIQNGINGFLVEKNSDAVFEGIVKAISLSPEKRAQMSAAARQFAIENLDLETNVPKELAIIGLR